MADQEFLASFAVEIDETGVSRLQDVLEENRKLADRLAASFSAASEALHTLSEDLGLLPDFSGRGIAAEGPAGFAGLDMGLDLTRAFEELDRFTERAKQPLQLKANTSGITSAARSAWDSVRNLFSAPLVLRAQAEREEGGAENPPLRMSSGGRFARPTEVQVAEDGDAEYIIPVKKEDRAVPLLRRLLAELSPAARESLAPGTGTALPGNLSAGNAPGNVIRDSRSFSAPVNIHVTAAGSSPEAIGKSLYDTAERYLLRTLRAVSG